MSLINRGLNPSNARGVVITYPMSDIGFDSDSLDVNNDIASRIEHGKSG